MMSLADPDFFADPAKAHDRVSELRRECALSFQSLPTSGPGQAAGFWAVLTHAEVIEVARQPTLFSASTGGVVLEDLEPDQLEMMRHMLLAMDPPDHNRIRKPLTEHFKHRAMAELEPQIRSICRSIMEQTVERSAGGAVVEFVHDVTSGLPTAVIGRLMGIPETDWSLIHGLAERVTSGQDEDFSQGSDPGVELAMYALDLAANRRAADNPASDLTSLILDTDFGGRPMDEVEFASFFVQLVTAGNDTTKTMLSSGLLALLQHPHQLAELRADPSRLPGALEEILRWANPLHYFRRTATADTRLGGVEIAAGDKVAMYYTSANRDEAVFKDPHTFDIHRSPNQHLSFGFAEHFCLGVHLARLEGRVFFEELLAGFTNIELAGQPIRLRSNLNNALKALPVTLNNA